MFALFIILLLHVIDIECCCYRPQIILANHLFFKRFRFVTLLLLLHSLRIWHLIFANHFGKHLVSKRFRFVTLFLLLHSLRMWHLIFANHFSKTFSFDKPFSFSNVLGLSPCMRYVIVRSVPIQALHTFNPMQSILSHSTYSILCFIFTQEARFSLTPLRWPVFWWAVHR